MILVVGADKSGKATLVQALLRLSGVHKAGEREANIEATVSHQVKANRVVRLEGAGALFNEFTLPIVTKYYTAEVKVWLGKEVPSVLALGAAGMDKEGLEGIIAVFDLTQEDSFEEIKPWGGIVEDREECSFRICLGSKAMRVSCLEWCLDQGFEYVEADFTHPERGGETREKEGVPRVMEALHSNTWRNMKLTPAAGNNSTLLGGGGWGEEGDDSDLAGEGGGESNEEASEEEETGEDGHGYADPGAREEYSELREGFVPSLLDQYGVLESETDEEEGGEREREREERGGGGGGGGGGGEKGGEGEGEGEGEGRGGGEVSISLTRGKLETRNRERGDGAVQAVCPGEVDVELQSRWESSGGAVPAPSGGHEPNQAHPSNMLQGSVPQNGETLPLGTRGDSSFATTAPQHAPSASKQCGGVGGGVGDIPGNTCGAGDCDGVAGTGHSSGLGEDVTVGHGVRRSREQGSGAGAGADAGPTEWSGLEAEEKVVDAAEVFFSNVEGDIGVHEIQRLMEEVKKVREEVGQLPDDQRRERAANVALRLAAMLDAEDGEEED